MNDDFSIPSSNARSDKRQGRAREGKVALWRVHGGEKASYQHKKSNPVNEYVLFFAETFLLNLGEAAWWMGSVYSKPGVCESREGKHKLKDAGQTKCKSSANLRVSASGRGEICGLISVHVSRHPNGSLGLLYNVETVGRKKGSVCDGQGRRPSLHSAYDGLNPDISISIRLTSPLLSTHCPGEISEMFQKQTSSNTRTGEDACLWKLGTGKFQASKDWKGADVNLILSSGDYGSALAAVAWWGKIEVVKLLLEKGADVNSDLSSGSYGSALAAAASGGELEVVK
ncbi:hypothetical protein DL96DRAFT_1677482 [Flagelloscypha sp. PMI_526]|nr:hypothetical protein DL96DRAFT_1677482 [Flagelloscypha sp. PMI_526]